MLFCFVSLSPLPPPPLKHDVVLVANAYFLLLVHSFACLFLFVWLLRVLLFFGGWSIHAYCWRTLRRHCVAPVSSYLLWLIVVSLWRKSDIRVYQFKLHSIFSWPWRPCLICGCVILACCQWESPSHGNCDSPFCFVDWLDFTGNKKADGRTTADSLYSTVFSNSNPFLLGTVL